MSTWVPDWSIPILTNRIIRLSDNASVYIEPITSFTGEGILSVADVHVGTIELVQPMDSRYPSVNFETFILNIWNTVVGQDRQASSSPTTFEKVKLFCDTLNAGRFRHATISANEHFPDFDSATQILISLINRGLGEGFEHSAKDEWWKFEVMVRQTCEIEHFSLQQIIALALGP